MQQQELAAALLRRRRAALALIVALALGLNVWYIWLRDPAGQGAGALLGRRSAAGVRWARRCSCLCSCWYPLPAGVREPRAQARRSNATYWRGSPTT